MALIVRIIVVLFAFFAAGLAAGAVVVGAVLFPDVSQVDLGLDDSTLQLIAVYGFIFVTGFALLPMAIVALITEAFGIRSLLFYVVGGAIVGAACYLSFVPFDTTTMAFHGIIRRELEVMTGAGIVAGFVYWLVAGRSAGTWRSPPPPNEPSVR